MTDFELIKEETAEIRKPKISFFEYLSIFILLIYAGHSNKLVLIDNIFDTPIAAFVPIILAGILVIRWKVIFDKQFFIVIFGFLIYFIALSAKYGEVQPTFFLNYLFQFIIAYSVIRALSFSFFKIYIDIVYVLAIIAIFLWILQTVLGGDTLYGYFRSIPSLTQFSNVSGGGLNAFIYSVQPSSTSLIYGNFLPRNCGFAWEPGGFAVFLCLSLFSNLFLNTSEVKINKHFWVPSLALITTQSTTGYLIFMVIIFFFFYRKYRKLVLMLSPVIIAALIALFSLPFMTDKIVKLADETNEIESIVVRTIGWKGEPYTPQRFSSFMIAWEDFRRNPVLGLGGHMEESWTVKMGAVISPVTGLGYLLAQFGLVGFLFFIILSIQTSFYFSNYFDYRVRLLFFIIILFTSVSYSIILYPLLMCFWMYKTFSPSKKNLKVVEDLELDGELLNT